MDDENKISVLDLLDRKILAALADDARTSHAAIAKKVRASRDTVNYRIRRLEEDGVIKGYRTVVDVKKLGFLNAHLLVRLKEPTDRTFKDIIARLSLHPFIRAILHFNGAYDLEVALVARDIDSLDREISAVLRDCGDALQSYEIVLVTKTVVSRVFPGSFVDAQKMAADDAHADGGARAVDEKDIRLLEILSEDALAPAHRLASSLGLSADAAVYRMKNLRKSGHIVRAIPIIGMEKIGYHLSSVLVSLAGMSERDDMMLSEFLRRNKDVLWAARTIGSTNIIIYLATRSTSDASRTFSEIRSLLAGKIRDCEMLLGIEEYKYTYLPKGLLDEKLPLGKTAKNI